MAWNEPDNDDRKNDPWVSRSGQKDQGPPDIDKVLSDLIKKLSGLFGGGKNRGDRSEEHTSELQSHHDLVCRLLLEKKKKTNTKDKSQT